MSDDDVKFIRNLRPNGVNIRVAGLKLHLNRRGAVADSIAVPLTAFADRGFQANFARGVIEEISKDTFLSLAQRIEDEPQGTIRPRPVRYQIDPENPTIKTFLPEFMSPKLDLLVTSDSDADAAKLDAASEKELAKLRKQQTALAKEVATAEKKKKARTKTSPARQGVIKGVVGGEEFPNLVESAGND